MATIPVLLIAISLGIHCRNTTGPRDGQTNSERRDTISVLINGKQWNDYFPDDPRWLSASISSIVPGMNYGNPEEVVLYVAWGVGYVSDHWETISLGFVFPADCDFDQLKQRDVDYLKTGSPIGERMRFYEEDWDVTIGTWDRYDSTGPVRARITDFDYKKGTVEVSFEGTLILNEWNIKTPYPGRRRHYPRIYVDSLQRSASTSNRVTEREPRKLRPVKLEPSSMANHFQAGHTSSG